MKRGDIVTIADASAGDFASKPRPALIVQADPFLSDHASVTVCLITSRTNDFALFRVPVLPGEATGLRLPSEVSVDKLQTVWTHRIGRRIGYASNEVMVAVEEGLRRWLAL